MWTKLTKKQVLAIRHAYAARKRTQQELAREYGVGQNQISRIVSGSSWDQLPGPRAATPVPEEVVNAIRAKYASGSYTQGALARMYDVSQSAVSRIVRFSRHRAGDGDQ